ncbi:MAG: D-sedoheptulose 7-phosphate isomerase [Myxococcota bacterium]|jgi:D-sedoheptulose 7-phosphate isomerase|nr:D-sedoheptulose 7-phosphate isomerase [Myxococcota bacterium]
MRQVAEIVRESIAVKQALLADEKLLATVATVARVASNAYAEKKKLLFCGNGGSASDAQHISAELSGRFYFDRPPLNAEALHCNTSYLTAVANDYSYDEIFARSVRGQGNPGDLLIGLTTSGNSPNVVKAVEAANELGMITVGMTGEGGGKLRTLCTHLINVPSKDTARIQESHILIGHILCELIEETVFGSVRKPK